MKRLAIAIAVGMVGIAALSYTRAEAQTVTNEATRQANHAKVIAGQACKSCDLFQLDFSYEEITNRDFTGSRLRQTDFSVATLDGSKFTNANLSILEAYGARFTNADFTNADMEDGSFVGAWFGGANFKGAKVNGANFSGAYLKSAKGLTQSQLSGACGDGETELPAGLEIPTCG
jgi:uncharacterized protein YjbI with pentapeptide repeats